jgi:hypothetical protein
MNVEKYGRRNVPKMIREWDELRSAIRAQGTPLIQDALDKVEQHIDYAYRKIGNAPRVNEAAETLITAMQDGNVWRHAVNAAMPILNADLDQSAWNTVTGVRAAINAALVAIKNGAA